MKIASTMKLLKGCEAEYKARHDAIWPELAAALREAGISNYYIYLDRETSILFAIFDAEDPAKLEQLPLHPIMRRWWDYMKDIMETNPDHSPVNQPLETVFYMQ